MKEKIKHGNPMLRALLLGAAVAALGAWTLSMAACDIVGLDNGNTTATEPGKAVYTGTHSDGTYTLTITEKVKGKAAAYTPKAGDPYTLKIGTNVSSGTVSLAETTGSTLKFTLKPDAAAANTFTATVSSSSNKITDITGTVTFDSGTTKKGPGNLSNSDSSGSSSSSGSVKGVSLDLTALSLVVGGHTATLSATVTPEKAEVKSVTWASSNSGVATVSKGTVTAVSAGTADITVTTVDGDKTDKCKVTVYAAGTKVLTGTVTITGSAEVGKTLTANTASLDGTGAISYQWKHGTANASYIGIDSSTYVVAAADAGYAITVTVSRSGLEGKVTSAPTEAVVDYTNTLPALTGAVSITGATASPGGKTAEVGKTLTAYTNYLGGSGTFSYQWKRGDTNISGTTGAGSTYTVVEADAGNKITVTVARSGNSGSVTSEQVTILPMLTGTVSITMADTDGAVKTGTPYVGYTLKAETSFPIESGTISYEWFRGKESGSGSGGGGGSFSGGGGGSSNNMRSQTYTLIESDEGCTFTVEVRQTNNSGYITGGPTAKVEKAKAEENEDEDDDDE